MDADSIGSKDMLNYLRISCENLRPINSTNDEVVFLTLHWLAENTDAQI